MTEFQNYPSTKTGCNKHSRSTWAGNLVVQTVSVIVTQFNGNGRIRRFQLIEAGHTYSVRRRLQVTATL